MIAVGEEVSFTCVAPDRVKNSSGRLNVQEYMSNTNCTLQDKNCALWGYKVGRVGKGVGLAVLGRGLNMIQTCTKFSKELVKMRKSTKENHKSFE